MILCYAHEGQSNMFTLVPPLQQYIFTFHLLQICPSAMHQGKLQAIAYTELGSLFPAPYKNPATSHQAPACDV